MSQILVTGAAGFVGANVAKVLINQGYDVVGVDSINDYYDPALKHHRLAQLNEFPRFSFVFCTFVTLVLLFSLPCFPPHPRLLPSARTLQILSL